jgi:hypothetical protein
LGYTSFSTLFHDHTSVITDVQFIRIIILSTLIILRLYRPMTTTFIISVIATIIIYIE